MPSFFRNLYDRLIDGWEPRSSSVDLLLWSMRGIFGIIVIGLAIRAFYLVGEHFKDQPNLTWAAFFGILGIGLVIVLIDVLVRNKQITTVSAVYFGLLLGLLLGNMFASGLAPLLFNDPTENSPQRWGLTLIIT